MKLRTIIGLAIALVGCVFVIIVMIKNFPELSNVLLLILLIIGIFKFLSYITRDY